MKKSDKQSHTDHNQRVTLRDIARELGISHVTVSVALRNTTGVSEKLRKVIMKKADEMGYRPDPMLSTLTNYRKSSKTMPIQATLAWINAWSKPQELREHQEFNLYWKGAEDNARRLGYRLEAFNLSEISLRRLKTIFTTRSIQGILLPPQRDQIDELSAFDWSDFAIVRFGQSISTLKTHFVTSAQMANAMLAFDHARQLGYKRIGFVSEFWRMRFFGVGYSWAQKEFPPEQQLPLLTLNPADHFEQQQNTFKHWLEETRPDAILTDNSETLQMLKNLGYRIPDDIGIATTSVHDTTIDTGIDQRPYEIGRSAVRILNGLIAEKSFGLPDCCNDTLIEGKWMDGSMLPPRR